MGIASIIGLIISVLPGILTAAGVASPQWTALIAQLASVIPGLIAQLATGGTPTADSISFLQTIQKELATLKADTSLDPEALDKADSLNLAVTEALEAYVQAETVCDPSNLTHLPVNF